MSPSRRRRLGEPLVLTVILLLYSNLLGWWATRQDEAAADGPFKYGNPLLVVLIVLGLAAYRRQSPLAVVRGLGLRRSGVARAAAAGALAGLLLSLPPLLFFARPVVLDTPLEYGPAANLSGRGLLRRVFIDLAIGVGLCEETLFRGLLEDSWGRAYGEKAAIAAGAATFAGWHFAVTLDTLGRTNVLSSHHLPRLLRPFALPLALAGGMVTTGVAGAIFSVVKHRSGSLWGAAVAHWLVDASMVVALWRRGRLARRSGTRV